MNTSYLIPTTELLEPGVKVWFGTGKKSFTVRASDGRFAICTQPYNFKPKTVIYTIIDTHRGVRGLDNMVFGIHDYWSDEDCDEALKDLQEGKMEVSSRSGKWVPLDIRQIRGIIRGRTWGIDYPKKEQSRLKN